MSGNAARSEGGGRPAGGGRQTIARSTRTAGTLNRRTTTNTNYGSDYTLAGPPSQGQAPPGYDPHQTYFQEGYRDLNPWMETQQHHPSFSLARTFPHNVRWGTKTPKKGDPKAVEDAEKGGTEPAPQVDEAENQGRGRHESQTSRQSQQERPELGERSSTQVNDAIPEEPESLPSEPTSPAPEIQHRRMEAYRPNGESLGTIADETTADPDSSASYFNRWSRFRFYFQCPLAEWLGTTVYIFIGLCGNLSVITSEYKTGSMQSMYSCWGFAVMLAIYIAGGGSGAFLNPALTIMLSVFRGFPAERVPVYILAQFVGAFTGALLAFAVYRDDIIHLDGGLVPESTGVAFYTQPQAWISNSTAFFTEMLGTAVIGCSIMALGDSHNSPPGAGMHAFIIGLLTTTATMALGYSTGGCFNPVRDLGPRLVIIAVGYPTSSFTAHQNWWIWGPCCATITGALLGGLVYDLCIFKGGESPVNFSFDRWRIESLKEGRDIANFVGMHHKAESLERKLESGNLGDPGVGSKEEEEVGS